MIVRGSALVSRWFFSLSLVTVLSIAQETDVPGLRLGSECNRNKECEATISRSQCHLGYCSCLPYYAQYNETFCVESTLLGNECLVDEQCSLKVANSTCHEGLCKCQDGYLSYRAHSCLGPARLGQVCFSNAHCQLWDSDTHCAFVIPDLFGHCQCTSPMRQDGEVCRPDRLVRPPAPTSPQPLGLSSSTGSEPKPLAAASTRSRTKTTTSSSLDDEDTGAQLSWLRNATLLLSTVAPTQLMPVNIVTRPSVRAEFHPNELPEDDAIIVDAEIPELVQTTTSTSSTASTPLKTDRHESSAYSAVSLGLPCSWDVECQMADRNSRCLDGICECARRGGNGTWCSARQRGCAPNTFQCRGSGACISWYFVCNGELDCSDGSDEECNLARGHSRSSSRCPAQAFRCKSSSVCVSRASLCDGRKDCPKGEDEVGCSDRRKCPDGAFRCNNGHCLPAYEFCNAIVSCRDGSDEPKALCRTRNRGYLQPRDCPFKCANGRCRSDAIVCSGRDGCGDNSDEANCSVCNER
ncbi:sortilin-related receptor-like [Copidosoma floridanum]|uniref:sortilin-related receptor-like n=1 Tax=Copidosoma floridanum TaxID=29053 RepID=UPI0006C9B5C8|nr:sortilin-related receptor-like [Copidosoma floridanum]